jgi:hypothetical protein
VRVDTHSKEYIWINRFKLSHKKGKLLQSCYPDLSTEWLSANGIPPIQNTRTRTRKVNTSRSWGIDFAYFIFFIFCYFGNVPDGVSKKKNKQKDKQLYTKHALKTKDRITRTPLRCSGRVSSSCSTSDTRRVNLITKPVISRERGKDREVFTFLVRVLYY